MIKLKISKILVTLLMVLVFTFMFSRSVNAETQNEPIPFLKSDLAGISLKVEATEFAIPGENVTVKLWINCSARGVRIESLDLSVYGFSEGEQKTSLRTENVMTNKTLDIPDTREFVYNISIPVNMWGTVYADLYLRYFIYNSYFEYTPSSIPITIPMTIVKNIYYDQLKEDFKNLNETYSELQQNFTQLNDAYEQLNQSYSELQQNYTALQGNAADLENTKQLAVILGTTTVVFVVTTLYMILRKPKQYW